MASIGDRALDGIKLLLTLPTVVLTALLAALLLYNFGRISASIGRLHRVVVPGIVEMSFRTSTDQTDDEVMEWATYYRASGMVVVGAKLDDGKKRDDPTHAEWIELRATDGPVDLAGGYIGDSSEMRRIPHGGPVIQSGECVRIVTFGRVERTGACVAVTHAKALNGEESAAFLRKDVGEGDRIVVFDGRKRLVLDVDYWVADAPAPQISSEC